MTTKQAADQLGVTVVAVRAAILRGTMKARRIEARGQHVWDISPAALAKYRAGSGTRGRPRRGQQGADNGMDRGN